MKRKGLLAISTLLLIPAAPAYAQSTAPAAPSATPSDSASSASPSDSSAAPAESTEAAAPAETPPPAPNEAAPAPAAAAPRAIAFDLQQPPHPERWVALAVTAGGLIAGGIFGVIALNDHNQYENTPTQDLADRTARDGLFADAFLIGGVLSAAVTAVLFMDAGHTAPHSDNTTGGHAAARMNFRLTGHGLSVSF